MTRHTRNQQLIKATKDKKLARKMYAKGTNVAIDDKQLNVYSSELDQQFEWKRVHMFKVKGKLWLYNYILFKSDRPWRKVRPVKEMK